MLKVLRKRKRSWVIFMILGAIIVVFIFWGIGNFRVDKNTVAAWVNGKAISVTEYTKAYEQQINYYRNVLKDQFNEELLNRLNLRQNTITMLVNMELGLQEAKRQGITVSTEDIQKTIQGVSAFHKDGVFDRELYLQVLKSNRIMPGDYEKIVRETLTIEKLQKNVTDKVTVADKEIEDTFFSENKKVNLQYIELDAAKFGKDIVISDADSKTHFEKNKEAFRIPTTVKVAYATMPFNDLLPKIKVDDGEIRAYYEKNLNEFQTTREVAARHILIKPDEGATDRDKAKEAARKKTEDILSRVKKGEDFEALARKYSEDPASAKQGGYLPYFKEGEMVKSFEDAAFSLKKGDVSDIVETEFGYHIIKAEDIREARLIPLKEARTRIKDKITQDKVKNMALETASDLRNAVVRDKREFSEEAAERKIKLEEAGPFSEKDWNVELVKNAELKKISFSLKEGEISDVVETDNSVYLLKILERRESYIPPYEEASDSVKTALVKEKAREKARETAEGVLEGLKQGGELHKVASKNGYATGETSFITKAEGYIAKIGVYVGDKTEMFSLTADSPYYTQVVPHLNKFYIFKIKESKEADRAEFEKRKDEIETRLLREKQQDALNKWLNDLRSRAKIEINTEVL